MSKYAKAEQYKHLRKVNAGKTTRLVQMTGTENQFLFIRSLKKKTCFCCCCFGFGFTIQLKWLWVDISQLKKSQCNYLPIDSSI